MKIVIDAKLMLTEEKSVYELNEGANVGEALDCFSADHPELGEMKSILISLNGKRSSRSELLSDGDKLELILLMGGG